jgi:WD40 repeat protein
VAPAPDAGRVAAPDGIGISVWDTRTGKRIAEYGLPKLCDIDRLSLAPDGKLILIGTTQFLADESEVKLWRVGKSDGSAGKSDRP